MGAPGGPPGAPQEELVAQGAPAWAPALCEQQAALGGRGAPQVREAPGGAWSLLVIFSSVQL